MIKGLIIVGLGVASAAYFLDEKKGKKRRARFKENFNDLMSTTGDAVEDYSHRIGERAGEWGKVVAKRAQAYSGDLKEKASDVTSNVTSNGWSPSSRFVGAVGSAVAFYAAGRGGFLGSVLRTLSLGLFTRALMASH
jgi:hypothetical protein